MILTEKDLGKKCVCGHEADIHTIGTENSNICLGDSCECKEFK